jgi:hypothetical protein
LQKCLIYKYFFAKIDIFSAMNRFTRDIIYVFGSGENRKYLYRTLVEYFHERRVTLFVNDHIDNLVDNFIHRIERESMMSDPIPGITVEDQIECYNCQFIIDRIEYIRNHVLSNSDNVPDEYTITDGMPTSRFGAAHHVQSADRQLQTWFYNSGRGVQGREDSHGDNNDNQYWGRGDRHLATGITFCDQSDVNTSNHVTQLLGTSYMLALNNDPQPHTNDAFGNATPASDARLLQRRIFRSNEAGVENGIPRYESRLYKRNLDRDVKEAMQGRERDCVVLGHDMSSLRCRVDHKQIVKKKYGSPDPQKMRLYDAGNYNGQVRYK